MQSFVCVLASNLLLFDSFIHELHAMSNESLIFPLSNVIKFV
jgi:hypothetical protein